MKTRRPTTGIDIYYRYVRRYDVIISGANERTNGERKQRKKKLDTQPSQR